MRVKLIRRFNNGSIEMFDKEYGCLYFYKIEDSEMIRCSDLAASNIVFDQQTVDELIMLDSVIIRHDGDKITIGNDSYYKGYIVK